jgi:hypothetical protein
MSDMDLNNQYEDHEEGSDDDTDGQAVTAHPCSFHAIVGWLYDKAVSGIAGIESAEMLAILKTPTVLRSLPPAT